MKILLILTALAVTACSTQASLRSCKEDDCLKYIQITEVGGGGVSSLISGKANMCKAVVLGNPEGLTIVYEGKSCTVIYDK